ncbi:MAG: alpha-1,2-fucosyltransferase, partial [Draconibacterium sp.]|nr:alpha-1,2-fucosyltransferase [Draconibacterium sp.]
EYYNNAIRFVKENIENPYFVIFSDDIDYVKKNINIENSYIVEGNAGYEDLYLMSQCNHFIIANSTFSFWAETLSAKQNKTVCVPEFWYNNPLRMADYIPEEWVKIPIK